MDRSALAPLPCAAVAPVSRRGFLGWSAALAGIAALGLAPSPAAAQADGPVVANVVDFPGATGTLRASIVRRSDIAKAPGVVLIHGEHGLTPFFEDLARRIAASGFVVAVPDLLGPMGGTPSSPEQAQAMIGQLSADDAVQNLIATVSYLKGSRYATDETGAVGFGWGARLALRLAARSPGLGAAVTFNPPPDVAELESVRVPVLVHQADAQRKQRKADAEALNRSLDSAGVPHETYMYQSTVFEDTIRRVPSEGFSGGSGDPPARPRTDAGELALSRTMAFLKANLGT